MSSKRAFIVLFVRYRLKQMDVILVGRQSDVRFWHMGTSKKLHRLDRFVEAGHLRKSPAEAGAVMPKGKTRPCSGA
jgi:hypothetical protein